MFCYNSFDRCWRMSNFRFWLVLQCVFMISGSWEGRTEAYSVFYIVFINVSRKLMREVVDGGKCSNFLYFTLCFFVISVNCFCKCFVKTHLTVVDECQVFVFGLFYYCFFMISGSWNGHTEAYSIFYIVFIYVSRNMM